MKKLEDSVMYIIINNDVNMGKGKIASQASHASCRVTRICERLQRKDPVYLSWYNDLETKIVLKASLKEMESIIQEYEVDKVIKRESDNNWCVSVFDAGRTQIESGTFTAIAFKPCLKSKRPDIVNKLKLL